MEARGYRSASGRTRKNSPPAGSGLFRPVDCDCDLYISNDHQVDCEVVKMMQVMVFSVGLGSTVL